MNQEEKLKERFGTDGGWKVPEGYFESFYKEMEEKLPPYKEGVKEVDLTLWHKMKPYLYLAAMFAGIWMMMKVFHTVSTPTSLSLDNPPENIAMVMDDLSGSGYFNVEEPYGDYELEQEVLSSYTDIDDFEKDFGYRFAPDYAAINVNEVLAEVEGRNRKHDKI